MRLSRRGGLYREGGQWWRSQLDPVHQDRSQQPLQQRVKVRPHKNIRNWEITTGGKNKNKKITQFYFTQNVDSSRVTGSQFAELQQTEHQLHQYTVSGVSCIQRKAIFITTSIKICFKANVVLQHHTMALFEQLSDLVFVAMQLPSQLL